MRAVRCFVGAQSSVYPAEIQRSRAARILHIWRGDQRAQPNRDRIKQYSLLEHALLDTNSISGIVRRLSLEKETEKNALECFFYNFALI